MWDHLPRVGSPLRCFTQAYSLLSIFWGWEFAFSFKSGLTSSFLKTLQYISKWGSSHTLFRQRVFLLLGLWNDCFPFVLMLCTLGWKEGTSWKTGLDTRNWFWIFCYKISTYILQKAESIGGSFFKALLKVLRINKSRKKTTAKLWGQKKCQCIQA